MKKILAIIVLSIAVISCESDENCLRPVENSTVDNFSPTRFKVVYTDANYNVSLSTFITPNGDALNDVYALYIQDLATNTFYVTDDFGITTTLDPNTTEDPSGFFTAIDVAVSNKCDVLYTSTDVNDYQWLLDFNNPIAQGNYNIEINLTTVNGNPIQISNNFDIINLQQ